MSIQEQPTKVGKPTNLKSVASVVPSIVAIALSVLSVIFSLLAAFCILCLTNSFGSVHLTTEAALVIFLYIAIMGFGFLFGGAGFVMGIVGTIVTLVNKRFKLIWLPLLAIVLGVVGTILMVTIGLPTGWV